jgi:cytochrome c-type biogenesis protein CcmH/NrfF
LGLKDVLGLNEVLVLGGLLLLAVGLGLWSVPLMLVVLGVLLLTAGLWRYVHGDPGPPVPPPE